MKLTRRSLSLIHILRKKYHRNFNNDKKMLIDHTFRKCSPVPVSLADLGGIWNVDGAYTFYTLKKYNPGHAVLVDTDFTDAAVKMSHSFPNLKLIKGNFGNMAVLAKIGRVDVFYMFDVLLHQVNPGWNEILEMYSPYANYIVIFNPQWIGSGSTVRLLDMGKEEYFRNVPHAVEDPLYNSLFDKMNDYHPDHNRIWRDIHNVWQWGITDNDLSLKMEDLGFRIQLYKNFGRFGTLMNFENHGFVYQRL